MKYDDIFTDINNYLAFGICRGAYARDKSGAPVEFNSKEAVEWCPTGAMLRVVSCTPLSAEDRVSFLLKWSEFSAELCRHTGKTLTETSDKMDRFSTFRLMTQAQNFMEKSLGLLPLLGY